MFHFSDLKQNGKSEKKTQKRNAHLGPYTKLEHNKEK